MSNEETKHKIEDALKAFSSGNLTTNATRIFHTLGYTSGKRLTKTAFSPDEFLDTYNRNAERPLNPQNALVTDWKQVHFLFQLTGDEIKASSQLGLDFGKKNQVDDTIMESYLFFALELAVRDYTRTELAAITREINKIFKQPVMILFRHGSTLTLSIIDRRLNKVDEVRDVLQKVTLIKDIRFIMPHRAHIEILFDLSLEELFRNYGFTNFVELHNAWGKVLDSSILNKAFYKLIAEYYYRLTGKVNHERELLLPSNGENDSKKYEDFAVRLIGRIIFCWFLKHKSSNNGIPLIPEEILSVKAVEKNPEYYHSILEPLFFEIMNKPAKERNSVAVAQADKVPFLNGGLFAPHPEDFNQPSLINTLKIPDEWFKEFFDVLERYKFTIDENTPIEEEIALDPEMLGRIFENLLAEVDPDTGETARKATGSYYTPRTIVDYMVNQSLKRYLLTKTKIDEDRVTALLSYESQEVVLNENEKGLVISALDEIKIIDPACGSGAFPMGILHKMLLVLKKVDPNLKIWVEKRLEKLPDDIFKREIKGKLERDNLEYVRKLLIIRNSIFGVDIQQIAVEISKLRVFLSLIVDETIDDEEENRGIKSLPNLEFKFVAANSLLGLPRPELDRKALIDFEDIESIEALAKIRDNYFTSYGVDKLKAEKEFTIVQQKMFQFYLQNLNQEQRNLFGTIKEVKTIGKTATQMLSEWTPFSFETSGWFDPKWMFGVTSGFDIVIANPPYLGEKGHKEIFRHIKEGTLKEYYLGKMDIFYFFFHLALNLGKPNSQITFITTNYYPNASGATKLRQDFKERAIIRELINFNELKIFESALGQHNMVTLISKGQDESVNAQTCITQRTGLATNTILQSILGWKDNETSYYKAPQSVLYEGEECYIRLTGTAESKDDPVQGILNKLKAQGQKLIQFCDINTGIQTGADKLSQKHITNHGIKGEIGDGIFVLKEEEIESLSLAKKDKDLLKPWYKNSDVQRWGTSRETQENVIYLDRNISEICENYRKYLSKYKAVLVERREVVNGVIKWWQLQWPRDIDFCGPKIVVPQRSYENTFGYNDIPWYASADVYFITEKDSDINLKYCLALLNSKLYYLWLYHKGKRKGEMLELYQVPLSEIPIKKITKVEQKPFISVVDKILAVTKDEDYLSNPTKQTKVEDLEIEIDELVYNLYGLTEEEKAVVKGKG